MFTFLGLAFSCSQPVSIEGQWKLSSRVAKGEIRAVEAGVTIGLWGDKWGTGGWVEAAHEHKEGADWFYFPLRTGLGTGGAALRLQGGEARLPLGARRGEFDHVFAAQSGQGWSAGELSEARADADSALEAESRYWSDGSFLLQEADSGVAGVLQFVQGENPVVMVFDPSWLTPESRRAEREDEGADIVLTFAVEPSLHGESGALRINVPAREAVVPASELPTARDRRFSLVPGRLDADRRKAMKDVFESMHLPQCNPFSIAGFEAGYRHGAPWLDDLMAYLQASRDYVVEAVGQRLPAIRVSAPEGTYLMWLDCRELGLDDAGLKRFFVREARVGMNPGLSFGDPGSGFMRLNIGCARSVLEEVIGRIEAAL